MASKRRGGRQRARRRRTLQWAGVGLLAAAVSWWCFGIPEFMWRPALGAAAASLVLLSVGVVGGVRLDWGEVRRVSETALVHVIAPSIVGFGCGVAVAFVTGAWHPGG